MTLAQCTFEQAFEQTARAGFSGIGLRYDQFERYLAQGGKATEVRGWLSAYGLHFAEAAFLAEWQYHGGVPLVSRRQRGGGADEAREILLRRLHTFLQHCEAFECANVTAVPALRETGDLAVAAEEFASLCDLARPYGVRLCLEFMGTSPQISTLASAAELVNMANRVNGGILIDTFLFHQGGSRVSDIQHIPVERIFNVQLADAKDKPLAQLDMLADRVFPGEGVAPVQTVVDALVACGYDGWWTVELFNPDYARAEPASIAARAAASAVGLFEWPVKDRTIAGGRA
ncbi:sugar phosphate isomerase/epimerase family protein [Paraburkholderia caffeinilytica]|uniref:sugar phosphate isomerase/epimerase family protein n=1 Tax=Paraburkholderia caffeinilytica TaxID=1761016 RepID=UPI0038BB87A2